MIDEIQYAPQLFPYIKSIVDREDGHGLFWLTGSQQFLLMKNITESLAGRVGILNLQGLSQDEKCASKSMPFLPTKEYVFEKSAIACDSIVDSGLCEIYHQIWKGSYPRLWTGDDELWDVFYNSYVQTYIERDVRSFLNVGSEMDFMRFIKATAARIGSLLDYNDIAKDIGVSGPTIKSWISVLNASGIIFLLQPYSTNISNRIIKTPKLYFMDTGLAAFLTGWKTSEVLESGAMNGAFFENYVISEVIKTYIHNGKGSNLYFYRDRDKKEIDLLIEENGVVYPVEIKKTASPKKSDIASFALLEKRGVKRGDGGLVCLSNEHFPLSERDYVIPVGFV